MKIVDIRATTISVPLQAPLRHAGGAHWRRFIRTIVEVVTEPLPSRPEWHATVPAYRWADPSVR